jgi:ArsR family transcriptional regulator
MEETSAIKAFAALAQEHRLKVFRLLVRHAPQGLPAGQIAAQVGIPASTMSAHLAQLERAGLLRSWREQRHILYAVETEGIRQLVMFLTEECCGGRPDLCGYATPASACQGPDSAAGALPPAPGVTDA